MEASIVSTTLVTISNRLHGFERSSWIVSGYQISYTGRQKSITENSSAITYFFEGFLVIWAKMSDIFGRKSPLILAIFVFAVFSAACGAAQTMTQL